MWTSRRIPKTLVGSKQSINLFRLIWFKYLGKNKSPLRQATPIEGTSSLFHGTEKWKIQRDSLFSAREWMMQSSTALILKTTEWTPHDESNQIDRLLEIYIRIEMKSSSPATYAELIDISTDLLNLCFSKHDCAVIALHFVFPLYFLSYQTAQTKVSRPAWIRATKTLTRSMMNAGIISEFHWRLGSLPPFRQKSQIQINQKWIGRSQLISKWQLRKNWIEFYFILSNQ